MIDFARNEQEEKDFIIDITTAADTMTIKYADGHESTEKLSRHNLNFYRIRMEKQAEDNMDYAYDTIAKDSFKVYLKRFLAIIGGIISSIVVFNVDIHIIIKIILTLLILLGEVLYYLYNELYLAVLADDLSEIFATDYYLQNINQFKYYDQEVGENGYIVPIEDIDKCHLTQETLERISSLVTEFKKEGIKDKDISLTYGPKNPENVL